MKWKSLLVSAIILTQLSYPANAKSNSQTPRSVSTSTASWSAVAYGQGQTPLNSAYTITWTVNSGKARDFFALRNTGNFTITGLTATVSQSQASSSGKPPSTSFDWCQNGIWNSSTNTCSGTIVSMGSATDVILTLTFSNLNLSVGSELSMRATTQPNLQNSYTSNISVFVSRSQIRTGVTSNS